MVRFQINSTEVTLAERDSLVRLFGAADEQERFALGDTRVLVAIVDSDAQQADDFRIRFLWRRACVARNRS
jgi:hypothetical protein